MENAGLEKIQLAQLPTHFVLPLNSSLKKRASSPPSQNSPPSNANSPTSPKTSPIAMSKWQLPCSNSAPNTTERIQVPNQPDDQRLYNAIMEASEFQALIVLIFVLYRHALHWFRAAWEFMPDSLDVIVERSQHRIAVWMTYFIYQVHWVGIPVAKRERIW